MRNETSPNASPHLTRYAWLAIYTALATISLKIGAYWLVDSVSLLSDAMESTVNLVAAIVALFALKLAAKPADSAYTFGRSKAEYFSAALEGAMIFGAAALIIFMAIARMLNPSSLENFGLGLLISTISSVINLLIGLYLVQAGKKHSSPALQADGHHLLTDVITTTGVLLGIGLIWLTGWHILDPIIAILVALNIIYIGIGLIRNSLAGLLDATLPEAENRVIIDILHQFRKPHISFHGLQTRTAGQIRYINLDVQVPGSWTVQQGHDLAIEIEDAILAKLSPADIQIHIEPIEDPISYADIPQGYIPIDDADALSPSSPA